VFGPADDIPRSCTDRIDEVFIAIRRRQPR
jgi:hypothetical protein